MSENRPKKPRNLTGTGAKLWQEVNDKHILDIHEAALVEELCRIRSHIAALDKVVADEGVVVSSPQGKKANPALTEVRAQRLAFARLVAVLDFPVDAP